MIPSLAFLSPSWRSVGLARSWSRVLASSYSTSTVLHSPSPLKMDKRNVNQRKWSLQNAESREKSDAKWLQANPIKRRELKRVFDQKTSLVHRFSIFLRRYDWPLQHLTWKTHIPEITEEKVKRACSSCGRYKTHGLRQWWKRRDPEPPNADLYDCFTCFYTLNPEHVVPVEYEGLDLEGAYKAMIEGRKRHANSVSKITALPSERDKPH
jgi:hypothetical protein